MGVCSSCSPAPSITVDTETALAMKDAGNRHRPYKRQSSHQDARWEFTAKVMLVIDSPPWNRARDRIEIETRNWERVQEIMFQIAMDTVGGERPELSAHKWIGLFKLSHEGDELSPDWTWYQINKTDDVIKLQLPNGISSIRSTVRAIKHHMDATGQSLEQRLYHPGKRVREEVRLGVAGYKVKESSLKGTWGCCGRDWLLPGCRRLEEGLPSKMHAVVGCVTCAP
eukprot:TRINITY_DN22811_c0_g1_i1.p1 TRINITY_DN22811_c0_g1~~TRINITY_DN22811_c0_g1_i1.p1  ORF type:complete len:226 (-),score=39.14 TRINITY_DN22811_c0_g1_i1:138-815(-)